MFGHVQANLNDLTEDEKERYRAVYCGLCRTLGERHGNLARLGLTYDLTFLALLLSSLYEPEETSKDSRCAVHPCKKHKYVQNRYIEYAADMTVALTYYKFIDDWQDDHSYSKKIYASLLATEYEKVKAKWSEQCRTIEGCLQKITEIEKKESEVPDEAANCFGELMSAVFVCQEDHWEEHLRRLGFSLGKYIYLADAAVDMEKDRKSGNYNPLISLSQTTEETRSMLMLVLGNASKVFEMLPLVQDTGLLRNILYSGLWIKFNHEIQKERKKKQ